MNYAKSSLLLLAALTLLCSRYCWSLSLLLQASLLSQMSLLLLSNLLLPTFLLLLASVVFLPPASQLLLVFLPLPVSLLLLKYQIYLAALMLLTSCFGRVPASSCVSFATRFSILWKNPAFLTSLLLLASPPPLAVANTVAGVPAVAGTHAGDCVSGDDGCPDVVGVPADV